MVIGIMAVIGCGTEQQGPQPEQVAATPNGAPTAEQDQLPPGRQYQCQYYDECGGSNTCCFGRMYQEQECYYAYCPLSGDYNYVYQCDIFSCWPLTCDGACGSADTANCYYQYTTGC
jgi:hypothetical protein